VSLGAQSQPSSHSSVGSELDDFEDELKEDADEHEDEIDPDLDEDENEPAPSLARRPDYLPHLLTNFLLLPLSLDEMKTNRTRIPLSQTLTHSDADTLSKQKFRAKIYSKLLLTTANNRWPSRSIREPRTGGRKETHH
jgi:hypothetical protein